ncbi:VpaChn25_0724 family phage protein [Dyella sp. 2RAB6]|uniref:VpaChn25_0724 family phage protein n=1 Tax=Dyella sp. 2RAB6 TaxID=3232992 RepID=UPI003F8FBFAC
MKTFADCLREDRRLVILRILSEQPGYRLNSSNLHAGLHHLGVVAARDDVVTDIHWLRDQSLLSLEEVPEVGNLYLCTLTSRGADVACGNARVPGVSRPTPR